MRQVQGFWKKGGIKGLLVTGLVLGISAVPAFAQTGDDGSRDTRWSLRGDLMWMIAAGGDEAGCPDRTPEVSEPITEDTFEQTINDGFGVALAAEYMFSKHLGAELGLLYGAFEGEFVIDTSIARETDSGDIDFSALTLGLNYHFRPKKRVDYYLGMFFTTFEYDPLVLQYPQNGITVNWTFGGREGTSESDTGFGWRGGIDVPFKPESKWVFVVNVRHFRGPNDIHPVMIGAGVGRRF
jgi:outer membrane protein W